MYKLSKKIVKLLTFSGSSEIIKKMLLLELSYRQN